MDFVKALLLDSVANSTIRRDAEGNWSQNDVGLPIITKNALDALVASGDITLKDGVAS